MWMTLLRRLALRIGWPRVAAVGLGLLWLTHIWLGARARPSPAPEPPTPSQTTPVDLRDDLEPIQPEENAQLKQFSEYESIVPVSGPNEEHWLLLTYQFPNAGEGIQCVDPETGSVKWHRDPVWDGRYTIVEAGDTTLVECTGYPQENYLAVRRLSDGAVLGRPWKLGRILDSAISGHHVAAVECIIVQHGREIPVTSLGNEVEGAEAMRVRVYDESGHVLSSMRIDGLDDSISLLGLPSGFIVSTSRRTTFLSPNGRRRVHLH